MALSVENVMFYNSLIFGITGIFSNLLCLFLVYIVKNKEMKRFRQLLMLYCLCDVFYSFSHIIAQPGFVLTSNTYLFFSYVEWTNVLVGKLMLCMYTFLFIQSITLLMILFVYRYLAISQFKRNLKNNSIRDFVLLFLILSVFPSMYCFPPLLTLWGNIGVSKNDLKTAIDTVFDHTLSINYDMIATFGFKNDDVRLRDKYQAIGSFFVALVVISVECTVMIYCSVKITQATSVASLSTKTRKIQKQLFYYLVIQTSITLSCCSFQVLLFSVATYFSIQLGFYGTLSTGMLAWFPILDAVILLTSVTAYRLFQNQQETQFREALMTQLCAVQKVGAFFQASII